MSNDEDWFLTFQLHDDRLKTRNKILNLKNKL